MPTRSRNRTPAATRRRALELLSFRDGCSEAILLAHGFTVGQIAELVRDGLATAHSRRVIVARHVVEIAHVRITEAGRRMLSNRAKP
jgi:SOS response regulatory protein OraA/RecX